MDSFLFSLDMLDDHHTRAINYCETVRQNCEKMLKGHDNKHWNLLLMTMLGMTICHSFSWRTWKHTKYYFHTCWIWLYWIATLLNIVVTPGVGGVSILISSRHWKQTLERWHHIIFKNNCIFYFWGKYSTQSLLQYCTVIYMNCLDFFWEFMPKYLFHTNHFTSIWYTFCQKLPSPIL